MALNAKNVAAPKTKYPTLPEDQYVARLRWAVDLGVQSRPAFKGQEKPPVAQIVLGFEFEDQFLPLEDESDDDLNKPRFMTYRVNLFRNADKGREFLARRALDPRGEFDGDYGEMAKAGVVCFLDVDTYERDGNTYNGIKQVLPMPSAVVKTMEFREPVLPVVIFDCDEPSAEAWDLLPDWTKEVINKRAGAEPFVFTRDVADVAEALANDGGIDDDLDDEVTW